MSRKKDRAGAAAPAAPPMNPARAKDILPEHLMVQTTSRCNAACVICPWPGTRKTQPQGDMDDRTYRRIVDELRDHPMFSKVLLYLMNEPLLDEKLPRRIDMMRKALPKAEIYILTNGILLDRDLGDRLMDSGLSWIGISVHAIESETYRKITGRKDFDAIRRRLEAFVDRAMAARGGNFVQVNITKVRPLIDEAEYRRAAEHWRALGVERVDLDDGYISRAGNVEVYGHDAVSRRRLGGCGTIWAYKMIHVLYDGCVAPCCMDWRRKVVFGNINEDGGLISVWRASGRRDFLDRLGSGEELPEDFLCVSCEDAIPAEPNEAVEKPRTVPPEATPDSTAPSPVSANPGRARVKKSGSRKTGDGAPDILLFNPPPWLVNAPPLASASLTAYLREKGWRVAVMDGNIRVHQEADPSLRNLWEWERGEFWEEFGNVEDAFGESLRRLADEAADSGAPVVGVNVVSRKEVATAIFLARLRERNPEALVFVGGPGAGHVELRKHIRSLTGAAIDGFIVGEGEATVHELLRRVKAKRRLAGLPGLALFDPKTGKESFVPGKVIEDLGALPVPDYSDFDLEAYESPALMVEWNRGCAGRCTFCNINDYWKSFRYKSPEQVVNELKLLGERHAGRVFNVVDPMVNSRPEALEGICDGIIAAGMDVEWSAGFSPNQEVDAALFRKMRKAGCYRLEFGVESGADPVLRRMGKEYRSLQATRMIRDAHDAGIMVVLYLIVGFPRETEEDLEATLDFLRDNAAHIDLVRSVNGLVLIHGTALDEGAAAFGIDEPNRLESGWTTRWTAGDNTPEMRTRRVQRVLDCLRELSIPVEFENTDDVISQEVLYHRKIEENNRRLDQVSAELKDLIGRIDKVIRGEPVRPVPGHDQVALVLCPVWGVDMPPLGVAALAAFLRNQGYVPAVIDFNIELFNASPLLAPFFEEDSFRHWTDAASCRRIIAAANTAIEDLVDRLIALNRRVIAFSVYSPNRLFTIEVMGRIKRRRPDKILIVGGRGVQTENERLLFPPHSVDFFVIGEGETTMVPLLEEIFRGGNGGAIPGVDTFDGHRLTGAAIRPLLHDLRLLPPPAYDLFDLGRYRAEEIPVQFARGCLAHCTFCNDSHKSTGFRTRSGVHMAAELAHHVKTLGVKSFRFNDLLINGDPAALEELCDALIEKDLGIKWIALFQPRGDMKDDLLRKMAAAGCYTVNMGVESGCDRVLKRMGKGFRVSEMETVLRQVRAAGINTMLNFIVGFPGEREEDLDETIAFVRRNREWICGITSVNSCILLEGSALEQNHAKLGITLPDRETGDVRWVMGDNTPQVREKRLRKFIDFIREEDIPFLVSNIQERAADIAGLPEAPEPVPAPKEPKDSDRPSGDGFDPSKGEPRWEVVPKEPADVLLIKCPVWGVDVAPLAIAYLAQGCRSAGLTVQALDLNVKIHNRTGDRGLWDMDRYKEWTEHALFPKTYEKLWELCDHYLKQIILHPARIVGFSLCTANYLFTLETARRLKEAAPDKVVVLGGPAITNSLDVLEIRPEQADYLFFGEGDFALPKFIRAVQDGKDAAAVEGFIKVGKPFSLDQVETVIVKRGTRLASPTMEELNLDEYSGSAIPLLGSRGCVRRCTFCNDHHIYKKYRPREAREIFADLEWHVKNRGVLHFTFLDLLLNGHMKILEEFCDLVIASGYQVRWGGQAIIRKEMTLELLQKMAEAGCQSIVYGVESFNNKVLKLMRKHYTQDLARRVLTDTKAAGIETIINLIVGFPGEGREEFEDTYNFLREHREIIDQVASVSPCLINLGSELFDRHQDFGVIFGEEGGSVKWHTADGENTYEERLRRVMALTELLAEDDKDIHTVNIYDAEDRALRLAGDREARERSVRRNAEKNMETPGDKKGPRITTPTRGPVDAIIALPPPWGVDFPPLGLATLAASIRERGYSVMVRDLNIECYDGCGDYLKTWWEPERLKYWASGKRLDEISAFLLPQVNDFVTQVLRRRPALIGLSTNESNLPFALRVAKRIRQAWPEAKIFLGGPGVAWPVDREKLRDEAVDGFVVGEGEISLPDLIRACKNAGDAKHIPGVEWRSDSVSLVPSPKTQVSKLDDLPIPLFDDFPLELYATRQLPLLFGRGCVNRCAFCNDPKITPKYRHHSAERILEQVRLYKERYGAHDFVFCDLLLNAHLRRLRRFAELVTERGPRISYSGQALIDKRLDADTLKTLARSGCSSLVFGVESFSNKVLKLMNKGYSAEEARGVMERCRRAGIKVIINLIVGFPGETEEDLAETMDFLRRNHHLIDSVSALSSCIVTARSALEKDPDSFGIVLPKPEHWCQWYTKDGENTFEIRTRRLERVLALLDQLGLPHGMTNRYLEKIAPSPGEHLGKDTPGLPASGL